MHRSDKLFCIKKPANRNYVCALGFSLIELLAIISIITIIAAIIVPIVDTVRNSARKTKSLSNLRQLASAIHMYSSDNKGFYPVGYYTSAHSSTAFDNERYWYLEIAPYLDQYTIANDPSKSVLVSPFAEDELSLGEFDGTMRNSSSTYSVHGVLCPDVSPRDDVEGHSPPGRFLAWNLKENPHEIILVGEAVLAQSSGIASATFHTPSAWQDPSEEDNLDDLVGTEEAAGKLSYRANGSTLVAFVDGSTGVFEKNTVRFKNISISPESVY